MTENRDRFYKLLESTDSLLEKKDLINVVVVLKEALAVGDSSMPTYSDIQKLVTELENTPEYQAMSKK